MVETEPDPPGSPQERRFPVRIVTAAALTLVVVVAASVLVGSRGGSEDSDIPQGVSARILSGEAVFIVRDGDDVQVFAADPRHLPGEPLWWCPNEQIFVGPFHGEQFARDGRYLGGPATGGLNEYPAKLDKDGVTIDTGTIIHRDRSDLGEEPMEFGAADFTEPWNSGPGSFCDGAVTPRRVSDPVGRSQPLKDLRTVG